MCHITSYNILEQPIKVSVGLISVFASVKKEKCSVAETISRNTFL